MPSAHDIFIAACSLGAVGVFIGVWLWVGHLLDDIPTYDRDDFWGL